MQQSESFKTELKLKANIVFGAALLLVLWRFISSGLLSQIGLNPPFFVGDEWCYKLFFATGVSQFITSSNVVESLFDLGLLALPIFYMLTLKRMFALFFLVFTLIYFFTFNLVTGHHYHGLVGLLIITIPFCFKDQIRFNLSWEAARYYLLYIFASAALWKIMRGSVFYTDQLSNILKEQKLDVLIQSPLSWNAQMTTYLVTNPTVSHLVLVANVVVQLSFIAGFFTKRFDKILFALSIIFTVANYFVMSVVSVELLILNLTLLNWDSVKLFLLRKEWIAAQPVS